MGNGEGKELTCTTHGHELRWEGMLEGGGMMPGRGGIKGRKEIGPTVIA